MLVVCAWFVFCMCLKCLSNRLNCVVCVFVFGLCVCVCVVCVFVVVLGIA